MHILYLHQYFVPPDGAGGTRSYEWARRLVREGHRVTVVTSSAFFPPAYAVEKRVTELEIEGIDLKIIRVPYSNKLSFQKRILAFLKFAYLSTIVASSVPAVDVVFATSTPLTIVLPGIITKKIRGCPMVFEVRDLWPDLPIAVGALKNPLAIGLAKVLERWAYWNSDYVVALSPGMKEGVVNAGYPGEKVSVVPNCCDVELFDVPVESGKRFLEKFLFLKGGPIVSYAGTFGLINGVDYLVDIAAEMRTLNSEVKFLLAGEGIRKKDVVEKAIKCGVFEKNLWIYPALPKKEIPGLLSVTTVATSVVIDMPEMWNNSANKFFDALAAGRPLMINHQGWQARILQETGAGVIVPPRNPSEAARILNDFLNDSERLEKARHAARMLAKTEFNRDVLFNKLHATLINALNESHTKKNN